MLRMYLVSIGFFFFLQRMLIIFKYANFLYSVLALRLNTNQKECEYCIMMQPKNSEEEEEKENILSDFHLNLMSSRCFHSHNVF